jgi:hypothetical protein
MGLRIISDCHEHFNKYIKIAKGAEYSLQLGDLYIPSPETLIRELDQDTNKLFFGNHNDYDLFDTIPHNLGDFGMCKLGGVEFFFVRGAFSIDMPWRQADYVGRMRTKSWWEREQMDFGQMLRCYNLYKQIKPDLVISHTGPSSITSQMFDSRLLTKLGYNKDTFFCHTASLLDEMLKIHRPARWYLGHFHQSKKLTFKGTDFQCLAELEYVDL